MFRVSRISTTTRTTGLSQTSLVSTVPTTFNVSSHHSVGSSPVSYRSTHSSNTFFDIDRLKGTNLYELKKFQENANLLQKEMEASGPVNWDTIKKMYQEKDAQLVKQTDVLTISIPLACLTIPAAMMIPSWEPVVLHLFGHAIAMSIASRETRKSEEILRTIDYIISRKDK